MVINLDRSNIDSYVAQPGIALLSWSRPRSSQSLVFDATYRDLSDETADVHFADVDVTKDPALAASWAVAVTPELMAYRDGTLVFDYAGLLPPAAVEALIDAIRSLDMEEVRKGVDGHGPRLRMLAQPAGSFGFALDEGGDEGPNRPPGGRSEKQ